MPRRRPRARSRGDHRHRTAWTADDRRQVEELTVRWRHNVPAIEWERLARRMGRTAAALRAWVWRNRPPRWRRHPWTESQLRRVRAQWQIGVAAGWSDRKIARAAAPTLRPHSVGSVYMQAYRLGLHGQPRPDGHEESPRGPPGSTPPPTESSAWSPGRPSPPPSGRFSPPQSLLT